MRTLLASLAVLIAATAASADIISLDKKDAVDGWQSRISIDINTSTNAVMFSELGKRSRVNRIGTRSGVVPIVTPPSNAFEVPITNYLGIGIYGRLTLQESSLTTGWIDAEFDAAAGRNEWPVPIFGPDVLSARFTAYTYERTEFGGRWRYTITEEFDLGEQAVDRVSDPVAYVTMSGRRPYITWRVDGPEASYVPSEPIEFDWRFSDGTELGIAFDSEVMAYAGVSEWKLVPEPSSAVLVMLGVLGLLARRHGRRQQTPCTALQSA